MDDDDSLPERTPEEAAAEQREFDEFVGRRHMPEIRLAQLERENAELRSDFTAMMEHHRATEECYDAMRAENAELRQAHERLARAARLLALETMDERIAMIAIADCHTNAAVVRHWRDEVLAALASMEPVRSDRS